ncbi:hypothetical protein BOTBODRAFT_33563 [Botryobasidium botryosum FD-172 SS1]|uniref:Uncharacterized protein n=1 Tax=Botryobasidium botryosum (strain FD-172 SS1) TaxID=930990 RepID=A0A067MCQ3_BOTB1|nr:hypothetical protein BOTBODRAFT_33563 [Botryobasidium botryosum FD-172 SS1]
MCYAAQCAVCNKVTWKGCGKHIDSVFKDVKEEDRCACRRDGSGNVAKDAAASGSTK